MSREFFLTPCQIVRINGAHDVRAAHVPRRGIVLVHGADAGVPPHRDDPIHHAEGGRSVLVVPLGHAGKIAGSLMLAFRTRRTIGEDTIATAEALASHVTVAVENARLIGTYGTPSSSRVSSSQLQPTS